MPVTVIAEFHAAPRKLDELLATLKQVLPETRAYDGCLGLESWLDEQRSTIVLTEQWESFDIMIATSRGAAKPACLPQRRRCSTAARPGSSRGNACPQDADDACPRFGFGLRRHYRESGKALYIGAGGREHD